MHRTKLTFKEEWVLSWWIFLRNPKAALYKEGINLGMAKRFAFKRAVKYGNN